MNLPAAADAAYRRSFYATPLMTAVMGATRIPVRTAPLGSSPVARLTPACPKTKCATDGPTAQANGTRAWSCAARTSPSPRPHQRARRQSFGVETESASATCGGVTTHPTALMAAMRKTAVSIKKNATLFILKRKKIFDFFFFNNSYFSIGNQRTKPSRSYWKCLKKNSQDAGDLMQ